MSVDTKLGVFSALSALTCCLSWGDLCTAVHLDERPSSPLSGEDSSGSQTTKRPSLAKTISFEPSKGSQSNNRQLSDVTDGSPSRTVLPTQRQQKQPAPAVVGGGVTTKRSFADAANETIRLKRIADKLDSVLKVSVREVSF